MKTIAYTLVLILFTVGLFAATNNLICNKPTTYDDGVTPIPAGTPISYNFYRGTKSDCSDCAKINSSPVTAPTFTDSSAPSGVIYYRATAVNPANGLESKYSNILSVDTLVFSAPTLTVPIP